MRIVLALLVLVGCLSSDGAIGREKVSFNEGWRFARFGAMPDGSVEVEPKGLEQPGFDDSDWRQLKVPHDWGIEGPFRDDLPNRTGKLPWVGIGWYRKSFGVDAADEGKRFYLSIDGAMARAKIWLNGERVGEWPYGYSSFQIDLTEALQAGEKNQLAIRLDNPEDSSRWYPGGGIYRNVWLEKTGPIHVARSGVFVTSEVTKARALVNMGVAIENHSGEPRQMEVRARIHEVGEGGWELGEVVASTEARHAGSKGSSELMMQASIESPVRWDIDDPRLHAVVTELVADGAVLDTVTTYFGVRTIEYRAAEGLLLNGRRVQMNGVCMHHDLGPLGAAVNTRAIERQIEILQEMGVNAIRTAHNPPAPELVQLCDRMGVMLQVEAFDCWAAGKTSTDYSQYFEEWHERDLSNMVKLYRNSPSVVMWSTGNEIREQGSREGHAISQRLTDIVKEHDTTRPVSAGCNNVKSGSNGFQETVDVFGYNYKPHLYAEFRKRNPDQPLYSSESSSCVSSRGEYFFPVSDEKDEGFFQFHVSSYDLYAPPWASRPDIEFDGQDRNPGVFGEFVWTGFDYIGEPTPYNKDSTNLLNFQNEEEKRKMEEAMKALGNRAPSRSSYFGIVDLCGFKKDRFYLYQARWRPDLPMAHILPHWNWPERVGEVTPVHVYTSGDEAELFLNGRSRGRRKKGEYEYRLRWDDVVYQPGELKVVAFKDGKKWAEEVVKTTGEAVELVLAADRDEIDADGTDLSFVTVEVKDQGGLLVPRTDNTVRYTIDGPGEIVAVGNGDPTNHESFQATERKVFNGLALVVIRSVKGEAGTIVLRAESGGVRGGEVRIEAD